MIAVPMKVAVTAAVPMTVKSHYYVGGLMYNGPYEYTPGEEQQIAPIQNKVAINNITINPVPNTYARVEQSSSLLYIY